METVENLLLDAGKLGLSMRQLKNETDFSKRTIFYFIKNSKNISNVTPYLHGSFKKKINVYVYKNQSETLNEIEEIEEFFENEEKEWIKL
jgi:hypothetical protein